MIMFAKIKNQIMYEEADNFGIPFFYNKMRILLFQFTVYLVFPALVIGSFFYISSGDLIYGIIEIIVGLFLITLVYFKKINPQIKTSIILFMFYVVTYFVIITTGQSGGGLISLIVSIVFMGLLQKSSKFNWWFIPFNSIVLIIIYTLLQRGVFDGLKIASYKETWSYLALLVTFYSIGVLSSISYYKRTIFEQFKTSEKERHFLDSLVNSVDSLIATIDDENIITMVNKRFKNMFGNNDTLIGKNYFDVVDQFMKDKQPENDNDHTLFDNKLTNGDFYFKIRDKTLYVLRKVYTLFDNELTQEKIVVLTNITKRKENEDKLEHLSFRDQLTGLYNRRFYEIELERLDSPRSLPLSMIMIDVNGLKLINDSFGHNYGDKVLIATANVISSCCRDIDIISRIGGDEFTIILPNVSLESARILANRIQSRAKDFNIEGIQLSFSLGIATKEKKEEHVKEIFKVMEDELYRNKLWETQSMRSKTIDLVLQTLYEKNHREMLHSKRVSTLSESLAKALQLTDVEIEEIKLAGLMHDIGKIGIDETILNKPNKLDADEWERMKQHSEIGYRILSSVGDFSKISQIVLHHHENYNGTGYPSGLLGEGILLGARIIRIADSYDAMTGERTYNTALTKEQATSELIKNAGSMFDEKLVDTFIKDVI